MRTVVVRQELYWHTVVVHWECHLRRNAARLLWNFRNFNFDELKALTVPTKNYETESGAQVLILTSNFYEFLKSESVIGK